MIKFWKSAAKGKSGCPVRPPEPTSTSNLTETNSSSICLETINEEDIRAFSKKSRLSMTLSDVLSDRQSLKYFVQFMESVSALAQIQFLIELENFKTSVVLLRNSSIEKETKISRTKSFDTSDSLPNDKVKIERRHSYRIPPQNSFEEECSGEDSEEEKEVNNKDDEANRNLKNFSKPLIDEAITLFKRYIALEAPHKLDLPDNVRSLVISNICAPEGLIDEDCFKVAQEIVYKQIEDVHFPNFQKSCLYTKAQIDILTNGSLILSDILYNEMTLFYFTEYLEQESCSVLLEFLMAVENFSDNLTELILAGSYDGSLAQDDAIVLYDKYFSLQATKPIGFSSDVRLEVEQNICNEGGPQPDCFHKPFRIVFKTLSTYVKTFLESELYFKYLTEMINSVDKSWKSHKKTLSDCSSSEFSVKTQNTLLAMGDPVYRKKKRNSSVPDMTIDSHQLYNGDTLWHRRRQDTLSLGRVNSLGKFESKFEPDPDKKEKSVLRKMVSKFVPSGASRVEEEMAWQVAHMIVKDITDLTMAPTENS